MRRWGFLLVVLLIGVAGVDVGVSQAAEPRGAQAFTLDALVERGL